MTHGSLFSGIGGFDLAAEWMGWENKFHCEWNEFGQKVLKYYWPTAELFTDITKSDFTKYANKIDILTGGFPCQPYSTAGKRLGKEDSRHLWPEMLRAIREIQPRWVVGENVSGLISWNGGMVFDEVQADLEAAGYEVIPFILPACGVNAPHRRDRVWFVAKRIIIDPHNTGSGTGLGEVQEANGEISQWNNDAEFSSAGDGITSDTKHGREGEKVTGGIGETSYTGTTRLSNNGDAPNSKANGCQTTKEINGGEKYKPNIREGIRDTFNTNGNIWDVTNPGSIELQGGMYPDGTGKAERHLGSRNPRIDKCGNWDNFPTQPPVCSRNDGLSPELVGITVSKHRKESIKGYGNAIVPQVALQIFKAIELYDTTGTTEES